MFSTRDGLRSNFVHSMLEDSAGNYWFGTDVGVSRFDGVNWKSFTSPDGPARGFVQAVIEDAAGNLWFGGDLDISRFDGRTWTTYTFEPGEEGSSVQTILEDRAGVLWFGLNGDGARRFDGSEWSRVTTADGLGGNRVQSIIEDRSGNLWFGTNRGVTRFDGSTWRTFSTANGLLDPYVSSLFEDRSGNIWAGHGGQSDGRGGVSVYDGRDWTNRSQTIPYSVHAITQDSAGNLWFGALGSGGLIRYDGAVSKRYLAIDGLPADEIIALLTDRSGNLWVATQQGVGRSDGVDWKTWRGGVNELLSDHVAGIRVDPAGGVWVAHGENFSVFDGSQWRHVFTTPGDQFYLSGAFFQDRRRDLWFAVRPGENPLLNGVARYDGSSWRTFVQGSGGPVGSVVSFLEDAEGTFWFGTDRGISRFDGATWRHYVAADGAPEDVILSIFQDSAGLHWFGSAAGVTRFDGLNWRTFTTADGLGASPVETIVEDRRGRLWTGGGFFSTPGINRFENGVWTAYDRDRPLVSAAYPTGRLFRDHAGDLWFGVEYFGEPGVVPEGIGRYDGEDWTLYRIEDGVAGAPLVLFEDSRGDHWFGTRFGLNRFNGSIWVAYTTSDGLVDNQVRAIGEDRSATLWFGTDSGVSVHGPDRVAPRVVFLTQPPPVSPARSQTAAFVAAFGEKGAQFRVSLDGSAESPWTPINSWQGTGLADGIHRLVVQVRDAFGNIGAPAGEVTFEVDAVPPSPVLEFPGYGQVVSGTVNVRGTTTDPRFREFRIEAGPAGAGTEPDEPLARSTVPITGGTLAEWKTTEIPDGDYEIRLSVEDTLGLTGLSLVRVIVDNREPRAEVTSPVVIRAAGGDVYSAGGDVHLYFPPGAFARDTQVTISTGDPDGISPPPGAPRRLSAGQLVSWGEAALEKSGSLEILSTSDGNGGTRAAGAPVLYRSESGSAWQRIGGTADPSRTKVSAPLTAGGLYAVFAEESPPAGAESLTELSLTPRVFSPEGRFADREAAIAFTLGRATPVTVTVHNRAGRFVRELVAKRAMSPGANLVRWDGRDQDGEIVTGGIYLVTVETPESREVKTVAVVR